MRIELYKSEGSSKRVPPVAQSVSAVNMSRRKQQKPRHLDAEEELTTEPNNEIVTEETNADDLAEGQICSNCSTEFLDMDELIEHKKTCEAEENILLPVPEEEPESINTNDLGGQKSSSPRPSDDLDMDRSHEDPLAETEDVTGQRDSGLGEGELDAEFKDMSEKSDPSENNDLDLDNSKLDDFEEAMEFDDDKIDDLKESHTPDETDCSSSLPQIPPLTPISMLQMPDSNVKLSSLENTKVAVAQQFAENNIAPSDLAMLQTTLYSLQQQQIFQLQLLQQLQQQIMPNMGFSASTLASLPSVPPLTHKMLLSSTPSRVSPSTTSSLSSPPTSTISSASSGSRTEDHGSTPATAPKSSIISSSSSTAITPLPSSRSSLNSLASMSQMAKPSSKPLSPGASTNGFSSPTDLSTLNMFKKGKPPNVTIGGAVSERSQFTGTVLDRSQYAADDPFFKHKCRFCHKVFGSDSALQIHIRSHTGERPFKCNVCGNRFSTRGNLKVHFSRHKEKYPHIEMNPMPVPEHLDKSELSPVPPVLIPPVPPPSMLPRPPSSAPKPPSLSPEVEKPAAAITVPASLPPRERDSSQPPEEKRMRTSPPSPMESINRTKSPGVASDSTPSRDGHHVPLPAFTPTSSVRPPMLGSGLPSPLMSMGSMPTPGMPMPPMPLPTSLTGPHPGHPFGLESPFFPRPSILPKQPQEDPMEQYMEIQKSETSKLEALVKNIESKLSDPNECAICHRILSCKSALQMHYRIHTGERPFRCKICGRSFTTKGNLKTHMGVHRAKPPVRMMHQCPVCHKEFTNALVLQQHVRIHTGEMPPMSNEMMAAAAMTPFFPMPPGFPFMPPGMPPHPAMSVAGLDLSKHSLSAAEKGLKDDENVEDEDDYYEEEDEEGYKDEDMEAELDRSFSREIEQEREERERERERSSEKQAQEKATDEEGHESKDDAHNTEASRDAPSRSSSVDSQGGRSETGASPYPAHSPNPPTMVPLPQHSSSPRTSQYEPIVSSENYMPSRYSNSLMALEERVKAIETNSVSQMSSSRPLEQMENIIRRAEGQLSPTHGSQANGDQSNSTSPAMPASSEGGSEGRLTPGRSTVSPAVSDASQDGSMRHFSPMGSPGMMPYKPFGSLDLSPRPFDSSTNTTCSVCYKTFACKSALDIHFRSHTKERPYKCDACDRCFSTRGNMRQHLLTHKIRDLPSDGEDMPKESDSQQTPQKPPAPPTPAAAPSPSSIQLKETRPPPTSDNSPFVRKPNLRHVCQVCEKPFSSGSALQIHMRTHTGDKPFKCTVCQKAFTTKGNLKVHMGTHMWNNGPSRRGRRMSVDTLPSFPAPKDADFFNAFSHRPPSEMYPFPFPGFPNGFPSPKLNEISVIQSLNGSFGHMPLVSSPEAMMAQLPSSMSDALKSHMSPIFSTAPSSTSDARVKSEASHKSAEVKLENNNNNNMPVNGSSGELDLSVKKSSPVSPPGSGAAGSTPSLAERHPEPAHNPAWIWKTTCHLCSKAFSSPASLEMHMKSHMPHPEQASPKPLMA